MSTAETLVWPEKKRELHNHHFDSTIWNDFSFRNDDVVVATYARSGTTQTQQIVAQLLLGPDPDLAVAEISPWLDLRIPPKKVKPPAVEAQTHRRFLKTHLPLDALVFSPKAKYIYIARDGRDVVWSMYNHHANANQLWYEALNDTPGRVGPPIEPPPADIRRYFREWLERDGHPFWPFWENIRTWWEYRDLPNLRMKRNASKSVPLGGAFWDAGARVFINRGTNGRWMETLTPEEVAAYEARGLRELEPEGARWLATGEGL